MKKVAVVILNWNGQKILEKFLPSVIDYSISHADVMVADNASSDNSVRFIEENYPKITIIKNNGNGGFSKGYNDALKKVNHPFIVLLNSDVEVTPNWIEPILKLMEADDTIAACQPKILSFQNKTEFEYAGAAGGFIDKYGYPFCRGRIFNSFEIDIGQYNDIKEIFWATGACLFIRNDIYKKVGGLDEDFFAHMEEIDLCWRIKNQGWKIMYQPNSLVYHVGGGTLSKINPQKTYLNFRNNLFLLFKNHHSNYFISKLFLRLLLDGIAGIRFLIFFQFNHFLAILKAHGSFYLSVNKLIKKRKEIKKTSIQYSKTAIYRKSIVYDYYIKGIKKFSDLDKNYF